MFKYAFISTDGFQGLALRGSGAVEQPDVLPSEDCYAI
jgi:hypothetical protein